MAKPPKLVSPAENLQAIHVGEYKWNGGYQLRFPPLKPTGKADPGYFCQVRFLWRCARSFLRRLCLFIFAFRRFFNEPINNLYCLAKPGTYKGPVAARFHCDKPAG